MISNEGESKLPKGLGEMIAKENMILVLYETRIWRELNYVLLPRAMPEYIGIGITW